MTKRLTELQKKWARVLAQLREAERVEAGADDAVRLQAKQNAERLLAGEDVDGVSPISHAKRTKLAAKEALAIIFITTVGALRDPDLDAEWKPQMPHPLPDDIVQWVTERYRNRRANVSGWNETLAEKQEVQRITDKISAARLAHEKRLARDNGGELGLTQGFNWLEHITDEELAFLRRANGGAVKPTTTDEEPLVITSPADAAARERLRRYDLGLEESPFIPSEEATA